MSWLAMAATQPTSHPPARVSNPQTRPVQSRIASASVASASVVTVYSARPRSTMGPIASRLVLDGKHRDPTIRAVQTRCVSGRRIGAGASKDRRGGHDRLRIGSCRTLYRCVSLRSCSARGWRREKNRSGTRHRTGGPRTGASPKRAWCSV